MTQEFDFPKAQPDSDGYVRIRSEHFTAITDFAEGLKGCLHASDKTSIAFIEKIVELLKAGDLPPEKQLIEAIGEVIGKMKEQNQGTLKVMRAFQEAMEK